MSRYSGRGRGGVNCSRTGTVPPAPPETATTAGTDAAIEAAEEAATEKAAAPKTAALEPEPEPDQSADIPRSPDVAVAPVEETEHATVPTGALPQELEPQSTAATLSVNKAASVERAASSECKASADCNVSMDVATEGYRKVVNGDGSADNDRGSEDSGRLWNLERMRSMHSAADVARMQALMVEIVGGQIGETSLSDQDVDDILKHEGEGRLGVEEFEARLEKQRVDRDDY